MGISDSHSEPLELQLDWKAAPFGFLKKGSAFFLEESSPKKFTHAEVDFYTFYPPGRLGGFFIIIGFMVSVYFLVDKEIRR